MTQGGTSYQARVELIDVLLLDYAALRAKGVSTKEVNLREEHQAADEARRHKVEEHSTAWAITCTGAILDRVKQSELLARRVLQSYGNTWPWLS